MLADKSRRRTLGSVGLLWMRYIPPSRCVPPNGTHPGVSTFVPLFQGVRRALCGRGSSLVRSTPLHFPSQGKQISGLRPEFVRLESLTYVSLSRCVPERTLLHAS